MRIFTFLLSLFPSLLSAKGFVVGHLMGQFGNQLFIIAATTSLALDHGATPLFPNLNKYDAYKQLFSKLNTSRPKKITYTYEEPYFHYVRIPYHSRMRLKGYFQSEKYFRHHKEEILKLFAPSEEILSYLNEKYASLIEHPCTVSIHFRNYFQEDPSQTLHPNCSIDYFTKAIALFPSDALFVVFSNDIDWCKENFANFPRDIVYIEGEPYYHDFYLMSLCKHNIISNSSFSWWGAYLNANPDKTVVAPSRWFGPNHIQDTYDLIPPSWITLD